MSLFIPLAIIMIQKEDGGIRACSKKPPPNQNVF
jgi:hypothetical protein